MGTAYVYNGIPLFFDAVNESGVAVAALNFPGYAVYSPPTEGKINLASFEVIPWVLCNASSVLEAAALLRKVNITLDSVSPELPHTPLHWMIADKETSVVAESTAKGIRIYDNPVGVMTNSPLFPYHLARLREYAALSSATPKNGICPEIDFGDVPRGTGAIGLPGDWSSSSRFVRAVFAKNHTAGIESPYGAVSDFFHIADTVSIPCGCVRAKDGSSVRTVYTSCFDLTDGIYYYTTYENRSIRSIGFGDIDKKSDTPIVFSMKKEEEIIRICD
jgi:choloylglycine hydrolase